MLVNTLRNLAAKQITARGVSTVAGPPQVKISTAEYVAHGMAMFGGFIFFPGWVLVHLKEYKGKE